MSADRMERSNYIQPLSTGGVGALLISLCGFADEGSRQFLTLLATFASPFIVHFISMVKAKYDVPPELISYESSLRYAIKQVQKGLKQENISASHREQFQKILEENSILLAKARPDYFSGRLKLEKREIYNADVSQGAQ